MADHDGGIGDAVPQLGASDTVFPQASHVVLHSSVAAP
jgi:hypothetical protein